MTEIIDAPLSAATLHSTLHRLADLAANETLPRFRAGTAVDDKGGDSGFDPVTEADRAAEAAIRREIERRFPDHQILGEEWGEKPGLSRYRWVIDPVDGTRAFVCGAPVWTTLIGVERDGVPIAGVIDQPFIGERWVGGAELPAARTHKGSSGSSRVSACSTLGAARLMVTDIRGQDGYFTAPEAAAVSALAGGCRLLRQGLDSYGFGLLAHGEIDLVVEAGLSWYDIAAVIPVVEASGGCVLTWDGALVREPLGRGRVIMAATRALAEQAIEMLHDCP